MMKMNRSFWAFAPLAAAMLAAPALASPGFTGGYAYGTWGSVNTDGGPTASSIDGSNQILTLYEPDFNADYYSQEFDFSHIALASGTVSFDWAFDGSVDACCSGLNFYVNGNLVANLANGYFGDPYKFEATIESGSFSIAVNEGDLLTFGAFSADGCCGASTNTISNFSAPAAAPEPASWAMMVGGFGLIGGAMRSRRRAAVTFA
jgi:hypothetical protein